MNLFYADVCIVYVCYVLRYVLLILFIYVFMYWVRYVFSLIPIRYNDCRVSYKSNQNCELRSL